MLAEEWIRDAYQESGAQAAEQPLTADMTSTAIRYANRMMFAKDYLGLGYTVIDSLSDEVTIPPYAEEWAVLGLAVKLCPQRGEFAASQELKDNAREAYQEMLKHVTLDIAQTPPSYLPMGSGNQDLSWGDGAVFYPGAADDLELTEDGGYTELEGS